MGDVSGGFRPLQPPTDGSSVGGPRGRVRADKTASGTTGNVARLVERYMKLIGESARTDASPITGRIQAHPEGKAASGTWHIDEAVDKAMDEAMADACNEAEGTAQNFANSTAEPDKKDGGYGEAPPEVTAGKAPGGYEHPPPEGAYGEPPPEIATGNAPGGYEAAPPEIAAGNAPGGYEAAPPEIAAADTHTALSNTELTVVSNDGKAAHNVTITASPPPPTRSAPRGRILPSLPLSKQMAKSAERLGRLVQYANSADLPSLSNSDLTIKASGKTEAGSNKQIRSGFLNFRTASGVPKSVQVAVSVGVDAAMEGDVAVAREINEKTGGLKATIKSDATSAEEKKAARATLAKLAHVVSYETEINPDTGTHVILSEWQAGGSLADRMNLESSNHRAFTSEQKHTFLEDVASGVEGLHDIGVIHKDLAARNVFISEQTVQVDGEDRELIRARVADFGEGETGVKAGTTVKLPKASGPLKWMAPEWLMKKEVSQKTDSYSLGVMIYEVVTGKEPYTGMLPRETAISVCGGNGAANNLLGPDVEGTPYAKLMEECLSFNPDDRPPMSEIAERLRIIGDTGADPGPIPALRDAYNAHENEVIARDPEPATLSKLVSADSSSYEEGLGDPLMVDDGSYGDAPSMAGDPDGAASKADDSPYGDVPSMADASPYGDVPSLAGDPDGAASSADDSPYGDVPSMAGAPHGAASKADASPYGDVPSMAGDPDGAASSADDSPYGDAPSVSEAESTSSALAEASSEGDSNFASEVADDISELLSYVKDGEYDLETGLQTIADAHHIPPSQSAALKEQFLKATTSDLLDDLKNCGIEKDEGTRRVWYDSDDKEGFSSALGNLHKMLDAESFNALVLNVFDGVTNLETFFEAPTMDDVNEHPARVQLLLASVADIKPQLAASFYKFDDDAGYQDSYRILSPAGMEAVIQDLKDKGSIAFDCKFCSSKSELSTALADFSADSQDPLRKMFFVKAEGGEHVTPVFAERKDGETKFLISDSTGFREDYVLGIHDVIRSDYPNSLIAVGHTPRQVDSTSCPIIAIRDAVKLSGNPSVFDNLTLTNTDTVGDTLRLERPNDETLAKVFLAWDKREAGLFDRSPKISAHADPATKAKNAEWILSQVGNLRFVRLPAGMMKPAQSLSILKKFEQMQRTGVPSAMTPLREKGHIFTVETNNEKLPKKEVNLRTQKFAYKYARALLAKAL